MKIAAIDLGSNTFHLIIAEIEDNNLNVIFKTNSPVKLSEDITKSNSIIPLAFERGLACLQHFKSITRTFEVEKIQAVATSAIRSAGNGENFIKEAYNLTGIEIEIISGEREAELIYQGVKFSGAVRGRSLIMDIGGGSTEFIFCDENKAYWKKSFDIGAARLMQMYWNSDPISFEDRQLINDHLKETLKELVEFNASFGATNLVGSAGAFETFIEMIDPSIEMKSIKKASIDIAEYKQLSLKLINSTHQERLSLPNLIPLRVDMIVMASILIDFILDNFKIQNMFLSTYDLKYGILQDNSL